MYTYCYMYIHVPIAICTIHIPIAVCTYMYLLLYMSFYRKVKVHPLEKPFSQKKKRKR